MQPSNEERVLPAKDESESIKELADRHMHDPNHHTTDEEIKNAHITFNDELEEEEKADTADTP